MTAGQSIPCRDRRRRHEHGDFPDRKRCVDRVACDVEPDRAATALCDRVRRISSAPRSGYAARMSGNSANENRLAGETSPYLLQHRHNPVDWRPWGPEALAEARERDVPLLVSIGYSACHWCHVMERESFEDPETAALMNERFVNVKVDREERPDV